MAQQRGFEMRDCDRRRARGPHFETAILNVPSENGSGRVVLDPGNMRFRGRDLANRASSLLFHERQASASSEFFTGYVRAYCQTDLKLWLPDAKKKSTLFMGAGGPLDPFIRYRNSHLAATHPRE